MRLYVRRFGQWEKVKRVIFNLDRDMRQAQRVYLTRWALTAEAKAKGHIAAQDLGWRPLAAVTLARKAYNKQSLLTLVETSTYFQSITSWVMGETAFAGVRDTANYRGTRLGRAYRSSQTTGRKGLSVADIAKLHEYGNSSTNLPARPLWRPVASEMDEWRKRAPTAGDIFMEIVRIKYGSMNITQYKIGKTGLADF